MFNADPGQQAAPDSGPLGLITQAREMAGRRGAEDVVLLAAVSESHLLEGAGEHERAVEAARRATADADPQLLARTSGTVLAVNQAEPLFALGRWDDALAIAAAALDHFLAPGPMNRALLHVITGSVRLARGDLDAASRSVMTARGALRSVRYEDQHQLPLARLEILLALAADGPAAGLAAASQTMDRFELGGSSPRYGWPVVTAAAFAVLAAARLAGPSHDERLRDEALAVADRLRTVAEKLERFGPEQRAFALTFAAADADAARLIAGFPDAGHADAGARLESGSARPPGCWRPGMRRPARGTGSASPIRSARRCCTRPRPRWPAVNATARRSGCSARPRWPRGWARGRSASRSRSSPGAPGSGWMAGTGRVPRSRVTAALAPASSGSGSPSASSRCSAWSRPGAATGRSPASCSSRPRRPASTCRTSSASWAWPAAARRPPRRTASACSTPPAPRSRMPWLQRVLRAQLPSRGHAGHARAPGGA